MDDEVLQHKTLILTTCPRDGFTKFSATAPSFQDIIVKMLDDADVNDAGSNSLQGHSTRHRCSNTVIVIAIIEKVDDADVNH